MERRECFQRFGLFTVCYSAFMQLVLNGQSRDFPQLAPGANLQDLISNLNLKGDRVAVEHNGTIVSRVDWANTGLTDGDRLEVVHFVGGGGC